MTALEQHVSFFDRNKDGIITPKEYREGLLAIGFDDAAAASSTVLGHVALAPFTNPPGAPLPYINMYVKYMYRTVHGSDTGAFDKKGRFVPKNFEKIFKHAHKKRDALNWLELEKMLTANRDLLNPPSWVAAETEWRLIHHLAKDKEGYLHKDAVRGIYDGSVFVELEKRRATLHKET
ncbi:hypothetical protein ACP70R_028184 [Stipagrostis hirtigluma subsp. patula]